MRRGALYLSYMFVLLVAYVPAVLPIGVLGSTARRETAVSAAAAPADHSPLSLRRSNGTLTGNPGVNLLRYARSEVPSTPFTGVTFAIAAFIELSFSLVMHELHVNRNSTKKLALHAAATALGLNLVAVHIKRCSYDPQIGGVDVTVLIAVPSAEAQKRVVQTAEGAAFPSKLARSCDYYSPLFGLAATTKRVEIDSSYKEIPAADMCGKCGGEEVWAGFNSRNSLASVCSLYQQHCWMPQAPAFHSTRARGRRIRKQANIHQLVVLGLRFGAGALGTLLLGAICWCGCLRGGLGSG